LKEKAFEEQNIKGKSFEEHNVNKEINNSEIEPTRIIEEI